MRRPNPEELRRLVDAVLDARFRILLRAHRVEPVTQASLGRALRELRSYWRADTTWWDEEDETELWDAEALIGMLDERAESTMEWVRNAKEG